MGEALFYSFVVCSIAVLIVAALILIIPLVILNKKNRKKARNVIGAAMAVMIVCAGCICVWLAIHSEYPEINNLKFLGKNIGDIGSEYELHYMTTREDGTGYAMIKTEDIVGHYVEIEYDMFQMDFDENGKITHVECSVPIGG